MPSSIATPTELTVSLLGTPRRGWRVRIPTNAQRIVMDDGSPTPVSGTTINVPSGVHTLRVIYAPDDSG
jgi:hypothetical protein